MIKLRIDGQEIEVEKGITILKAAKSIGIEIPTLCHYEMIEPYGVCRICTVEILRGKRRRLVTACNYPITSEIEVFTSSERVIKARKVILELLLARCPNVKIVQDLAEKYEVKRSRFEKGDEECILCGNCVNVCREIIGKNIIGFEGRGITRKIVIPYDEIKKECITCGACAYVCPTGYLKIEDLVGKKINHHELSLGPKTPIYVPFMQAVPNAPIIDPESCIHFQTEKCKICERVCEAKAINHEAKEEIVDVEVGSIIVATGYKLLDPKQIYQFGYGSLPNVITSLEFEKMNCASGPTSGKILLEDGNEPKSIGILHCVGSRDTNYCNYCSQICCMYALKFAHLIREKIKSAMVYNFYIDMRCVGKGYEEFYNRLLEEDIRFVRGKVAALTDFAITDSEKGKIIIRVEDTLAGYVRRIPVDMVILCPAIKTGEDADRLGKILALSRGRDGFFIEKHPKLGPVETATDGIFIAGCCQGPKDIPHSVAQGSAVAAEALSLIMQGKVELEAQTSVVNEDLCAGCKICNKLCPYEAISFDEKKKVSKINEALCKGCGTCASSCPNSAISAKHFTDTQIFAEIEGILL